MEDMGNMKELSNADRAGGVGSAINGEPVVGVEGSTNGRPEISPGGASAGLQPEGDEGAQVEGLKDMLRFVVASGKLKRVLEGIAGAMDFSKAAVDALAQVAEKAQEKMDGKTESMPGPMGAEILSDMWLPMLLNIMKTPEFQHILANMVVTVIK